MTAVMTLCHTDAELRNVSLLFLAIGMAVGALLTSGLGYVRGYRAGRRTRRGQR